MRKLTLLDNFRMNVEHIHGWNGDETCGCFAVPSPIDRQPLLIQASCDGEWDHVSVSRKNRIPNWIEMEHIRKLFFRENEVVMQLHLPTADHINIVANCLHLWRPQRVAIPLPPKEFV